MPLAVKSVSGKFFTITLDSGANVSFMSKQLCVSLGLEIRPNGQLATLADPQYSVKSVGEVDFVVTECTSGTALLRVRALVLEKLAVPCYGGTTFHLDNHLVPDITTSTIWAHGFRFAFQIPPHNQQAMPPPSISTDPFVCSTPSSSKPPMKPLQVDAHPTPATPSPSPPTSTPSPLEIIKPTGEPILMKAAKTLLPEGSYNLPLQGTSLASSVLVLPPTPRIAKDLPPQSNWNPQICPVVSGSAVYINQTGSPLSHPKNTHFRMVPMAEQTDQPSLPLQPKQALLLPAPSPDSVLSKIRINTNLLSESQQGRLLEIHTRNLTAFNNDMRKGFYDEGSPYRASFSFRKESRPPPFKIWAPQYNRRCLDLLQAKCDQLELQGVLVDPKQVGEDVRNVSPCFVTQKARAKHKQLEHCSLDEIRFITCFNVLNDSIHPIPGRSNSYNDILKFLGRQRYLICADLSNSYFQIKMDRKCWRYMAIMTPHRGLKILTRLGQGLLNSDVDLDQVLGRVLGDEQTAGFCLAARDDVFVGGDTIEECLANWDTVLSKLNQYNLKLNPNKVRIMLGETEVFGHRVVNGTVRPSEHILTSLAATTPEDLVTVKQVNSWKGLYKTLIRHLPHLAAVMMPFDKACSSKASSSKFDWSRPGILAAFNTATSHLKEIKTTYLPRPEEQLVLQPDTSSINLCTGWVLYTLRPSQQGTQWLPVQYASGKLSNYMEGWSPCEKEGVGAVLAIDQVRHWVNESHKTTIVMPDNKPVIQAADLMKLGKHSTNSRLQQLLASVNRSNIKFMHNSAKAGFHTVPDALSRLPRNSCCTKDCQVERFLDDIPDKVQFMPITLATLSIGSLDPATLAAIMPDLTQLTGPGAGPIPLGSRQTWINLQADCPDCIRFINCKKEGQMPGAKDKDRAILNKMFKVCEVQKGLIVSKFFDPILMKETSRVYVPAFLLDTILTTMHVRLSHPLPTQLLRIFERYFIAFRVRGTIDLITSSCSFCIALARFPAALDNFNPSPGPLHPGSHMNADVLRRASQHIMVSVDRFSNFVTASFVGSETREAMIEGILAVVTPVRHCSRVQVRTDRARGLSSLAERPDQQLQDNGIDMVLGDHANPNKNASVDKSIQELEAELRRLSPEGLPVSLGTLSQAVTTLNNRIRSHGLSASQVHFSRDFTTGKNLSIKDDKLWLAREERKIVTKPKTPPPDQPTPRPGQVVFLKKDGDKHTARDPFIVTNTGPRITVQRMCHTNPHSSAPPRITSDQLKIDPKFLYVPPHRRLGTPGSGQPCWRRPARPPPRPPIEPPTQHDWRPTRPIREYDWDEIEASTTDYGRQRDAEEEEEGEVGAEDEEEMAEAGGGDAVGRGGEGGEAAQHLPHPVAVRGPRRRPPREQWIIHQDAQQVEVQPVPAQIVLQEEAAAQVRERGLTRGGRVTKAPDRYGIEQNREEEQATTDLNISTTSFERELTPAVSSSASTPNLSPVITPALTPAFTPDTSPDTSAVILSKDQRWLPPDPDMSEGRTSSQRGKDVLERHRHRSDPGPDAIPQHPRFQEWDPGPEGRGGAPNEL